MPLYLRAPLVACLCLTVAACGGGAGNGKAATSGSPPSRVAASANSNSGLVPFEGDGFSARMPTAPKRSTQQITTPAGPVTAVLYLSDGGTTAYVLSYVDLPNGQGNLPGAIAGAAKTVGGAVHEENATTYRNFPARDARITGANGGRATVFTRAILAKGRLYQLQYVQEGGNVTAPPAVYQRFLNSLRID